MWAQGSKSALTPDFSERRSPSRSQLFLVSGAPPRAHHFVSAARSAALSERRSLILWLVIICQKAKKKADFPRDLLCILFCFSAIGMMPGGGLLPLSFLLVTWIQLTTSGKKNAQGTKFPFSMNHKETSKTVNLVMHGWPPKPKGFQIGLKAFTFNI